MRSCDLTTPSCLFRLNLNLPLTTGSWKEGWRSTRMKTWMTIGNSFFCKLHYDPNLARFEDPPAVSMPEDFQNQSCPLLSCLLFEQEKREGWENWRGK